MIIEVQVPIHGSKSAIWRAITDIDNSPNMIQGIEEIEVLQRPEEGLVGLKWRETRTLFGRTATEVMWITDEVENVSYKTRAESHGAVYVTELAISGDDGDATLTMKFGSTAQSFGARLSAATLGLLFKNATKKALVQDVNDIKAAVEGRSGEQA